jgi:hypothetical protein
MYYVLGYKRIEDLIQRLDPKFVQQFADERKTPEIYQYLQAIKTNN